MKEKLVLAYSGGLDTTVILHWLVQKGYEVTAVLVNLGQKCEDQDTILKKALDTGAADCRWLDVRDEFVTGYVYPAIWANALYEGRYHLGTSLARPLIAKCTIDVCNEIGAGWASHGATGKGNDQVRFELSFYALKPDIQVLSPWRDREFQEAFQGRKDMIEYTKKYNLPVVASADKPYSMDDNLLHISYESGVLEDPNRLLEKEDFRRTADPAKAPDEAERVSITFERGCPIAVNGKRLEPAVLLDRLNETAGRHGIGRVDMVETRYVGMKSRGVYETPGGTLLYFAHRDLEGIAQLGSVIADKEMLMPVWAQRVYQGYWFDPSVQYLTRYFEITQEHVNGTITVELYKGNMTVVGRECESDTLYNMDIVSMDTHIRSLYDQTDASGFIRIHGLPLRLDAERRRKR